MSIISSINSMRDGLNQWLSLILKLAFIAVIVLAVLWGGMSVWANVFENRELKLPDINKAQYELLILATGEILMTNSYDVPGDGIYVLHGVYRIDRGKWRYQEDDLPLSVEYFGPLIMRRR